MLVECVNGYCVEIIFKCRDSLFLVNLVIDFVVILLEEYVN